MKRSNQADLGDLSAPAQDELSIIRRVAGGDRTAFEILMRRYNRRLYRLARAALRDDAEAKDALQDAYLCAYRSIGSFRGEASLATWLSRLVLNACNARRRRSARRENIVPMVSADRHAAAYAEVTEPGQAPDDLTARAQLRAVIESKLGELPEAYRLVFVLRAIEELSVEEVAAALALSPEAVRSRHFRARGMLRESLARELDLAEGDIFGFGGEQCDQVVDRVLARIASEILATPGA